MARSESVGQYFVQNGRMRRCSHAGPIDNARVGGTIASFRLSLAIQLLSLGALDRACKAIPTSVAIRIAG